MYFSIFFVLLGNASAYKILGVFTSASPSHYFLGNELIKGIARAGHETTILTLFEETNPPKDNYEQIILDGVLEIQQRAFFGTISKSTKRQDEASKPNTFVTIFNTISRFDSISKLISETTLSHNKTQELIKSKAKFDVVIVPQFFQEALKALAPHFDAHLVVFHNLAPNSWVNNFIGNAKLPSLTAELALGYTGRMTFTQRLLNTLFRITQYTYFNNFMYADQKELVHKYISKELDLDEIMYNVSLVLSNSHVSINKAEALVPCVKQIAGFHVKPPKKLPEDLQKYMDDAEEGIVYFSLGSNVKSAELPMKTKNALMAAFSKRKEKILWKFEEDMPDRPANVMIRKWLPQSDILAHPNLKLFITHGGFLSTIETIHYGVPIISVPIFGDQYMNANVAESDGYSKVLDLKTITEESVSSAIEEVLSNKKYKENAEARSKIFHERQIKPMDEAVYWIKYIVKYNGAHHLKVHYVDMPWYQYYLLDVFASIFLISFGVLFILKTALGFVFRKLCDRKNKVYAKKVKKQ